MSGHLRAVVALLLPDVTSRRAFEETLADWREERAGAGSPAARAWAELRGVAAMARVGAGAARTDFARPGTWRFFGWTVLAALAVAFIRFAIVFVNSAGWPVSPLDRLLAGGLMIPTGVAVFVPVLAAIGLGVRRDQAPPVLAGMLASMLLVTGLAGWVAPAANQAYRELVLAALSSGERRDLPPGPNELSLAQHIAQARTGQVRERWSSFGAISRTTMLIAAGPTFLLLGVALRRRIPDRVSWRLAQAAGGVLTVALVFAGQLAALGLYALMDWTGAVQLQRLSLSSWMALALAWVTTLAFLSTSSLTSAGSSRRPRRSPPSAPCSDSR